jgi:hypothetical protein
VDVAFTVPASYSLEALMEHVIGALADSDAKLTSIFIQP